MLSWSDVNKLWFDAPFLLLFVCYLLVIILDYWDRWTIVKLYTQENDFWAPDGDQTRNLLMTGETL